MEKAIITGGAGFIGSYLAEYLQKKKIHVTIIDNLENGSLYNLKKLKKNYKFIRADISKEGSWTKSFKNKNVIFHLAALSDIVPSISYPEKYFESNVLGTLNVLNTMRKYTVKKLVYAASSSCYGIPKHYPTKESEIIDPKYPYALTKKIGEDLLMHWSKVYNLNCTSLRLFNVYGPRVKNLNDYGAMFGIFLAQKLAGKPLTVVGNGNQSRDFTYVTDVCNAFFKSYKNKISKGKIYNVGSGKTISINKIVHLLKSKKIFIPKRPGEPSKTFANISKIKKELNWKPNIPIEKGIKIMIKNINNWKKAPVWDKEEIAKKTKLWFKYLKK